jgi:aldose 1-epimerase
VIELSIPGSLTRAKIAPDFGFNCFDFIVQTDGQTFSIIDAEVGFPKADSRPSGHGIPLLFPYPNRIREGKYDWGGTNYELPPECVAYNRTNAIHGFCLDRPWRVIQQSEQRVTAEFQLSVDAPDRREFWPADFLIRGTYTLHKTALAFDLHVENVDAVPLPWGFGTHAYFKLPLSSRSSLHDCLMIAPVDSHWEVQDGLPTGAAHPLSEPYNELPDGLPVGTVKLDDAFRLAPGTRSCAIMDQRAGYQITQSFSQAFTQLVIFTPPARNAVCLEPYTCLTDAMNLPQTETGLRILPPGESESLNVTISLEPVVA